MKFFTLWKDKFGKYTDRDLDLVPGPDGAGYVVKWRDVPPLFFADIEHEVVIPKGCKDECVHDLQQGSEYCFCADLYVVDGKEYLVLAGNGWKDVLGYPFGEKRYPTIGGETCKRLLATFKRDRSEEWDKVFSGDLSDLHVVRFEEEAA